MPTTPASSTPSRSPAPTGRVLVLEAATAAGSLALYDVREGGTVADGKSAAARVHWHLLGALDVPMGNGREDRLTPGIRQLLAEAGQPAAALDAVVCGSGPGSFTSLRIAASTAKGLLFDSVIPLFAVPSLLLAAAWGTACAAPGDYLLTMDALRGERYVQRVRVRADGMCLAVGPLGRASVASLEALAAGTPILLAGPDGDAVPHSQGVERIADWKPFGPVQLDAWEPEYGRLAEAQVKWEAAHGHALPAS